MKRRKPMSASWHETREKVPGALLRFHLIFSQSAVALSSDENNRRASSNHRGLARLAIGILRITGSH